MAERYPGGVISKTPPVVTGPTGGEGGSASGVWTLDTVLEYEKAGAWPKPTIPRELYAWGNGGNGRTGLNLTTSTSSPVQVGALQNWSQISAGADFSLARKIDGTLWSWGENGQGQLGTGDVVDKSSPVQVGALTNWSQVAAGGVSSAAIKSDNTLWTWGSSGYGQLGDGTKVSKSSPIQVGSLTNWLQVSVSKQGSFGRHCVAVKTNGTLWSWGDNTYAGQLGDGTTISKSSPIQIGALTNWSQVSANGVQSAAVNSAGSLYVWGSNVSGRLGLGDISQPSFGIITNRSSPVQVGALTNWAQVSVGTGSMSAVKTDGTLWAWGGNTDGVLGDNTTASRSSPVQIGALTNWSQVSVAVYNAAAIKTDGTLWSWGGNSGGTVGDNTTVNRSSPVQVGAETDWISVSNGNQFNLAVAFG